MASAEPTDVPPNFITKVRGIDAEIEIFEEYAPALGRIDGFSHLIVLFYLHKTTGAQRETLQARPKRFVRYGLKLEDLPLVGVFCLDSPHRPNPLGLTIVKLLSRQGNILTVSGLDAFNNTPVLDIKPYLPYAAMIPPRRDATQHPDFVRTCHPYSLNSISA